MGMTLFYLEIWYLLDVLLHFLQMFYDDPMLICFYFWWIEFIILEQQRQGGYTAICLSSRYASRILGYHLLSGNSPHINPSANQVQKAIQNDWTCSEEPNRGPLCYMPVYMSHIQGVVTNIRLRNLESPVDIVYIIYNIYRVLHSGKLT